MGDFRKLYIANTTIHHYEFWFRVPGIDRPFMTQIKVGGQEQIYKDADIDTLEYIIKQHQNTPKPFLISVDELSRNGKHIGLIYSFDKPVNMNQIERKFNENKEALVQQGKDIRIEYAVSLSNALDEKAQEMGGEIGEVRTEVVEDVKPGESVSGKIAEGVVVESRRGRPRKG